MCRPRLPLLTKGGAPRSESKITMTAGGSHTIIHAVMAVSRKAVTEGIRTSLFFGHSQ